MIKMTKAEALRIQAEQIKWYCSKRPDLAKLITNATTADALEDGVEYDIITINKHIPRGAAIEYLLGSRFGHLD